MRLVIYEVSIGGYFYIGKDRLQQREKQHRRMLESGSHYNIFMQNVYNKYREFNYREIVSFDSYIEDSILSDLESYYIRKYRTLHPSRVMNLTDGGEGGAGHIKTPTQIEKSREQMLLNNPSRKIPRATVPLIYKMFDSGKSNEEIAEIYNISPGHVSSIRIGAKYPDLYKEYYGERRPSVSPGRQKLTYEQFLELIKLKKTGLNYKEISELTGIGRSTINRIFLKESYKLYWGKYDSE